LSILLRKKIFKRRLRSLIALYLITGNLLAQDTSTLAEVDIIASKNELSSIGKRVDKLDSLQKKLFIYNSVADALNLNSTVFIKNYGPGALSSSSMRGGNASQTAILWDGFNIQNSMLGQNDLSMLPTVLFDNMEVESGGSSSIWGSGAVGGSIRLTDALSFNNGFTSRVNLNTGSFGLLNASTKLELSKTKFVSSTKAYLQNSNNNFKYKDTLNKENTIQEQKNAAHSFKGLMQEIKYLIKSNQNISAKFWYNAGDRQIPSNKKIPATQSDRNLKTNICWNYYKNSHNNALKAAYFNDVLNYKDSLLGVDSKSNINTLIFEDDFLKTWGKNNKLNLGLNYTYSSALSNNYTEQKTFSKISAIVGNKFALANNKLIVYPVLRAEYFSLTALPITGNISAEYLIIDGLKARFSGARVYRQPTFNELFWQPGGNINLKPEEGYTYDGDLEYNKQLKNIYLSISGSVYSKQINNWILWLPGGAGAATPENIQSVWSRGTESRLKINYSKNKFLIALNIFTAYTLSTIHITSKENSATLNKQLIYTPRYTGNANLTLAYEGISLTYFQKYNGYRFTTSDNSQWLNPYHYSSARINVNANFKPEAKALFYLACNNLFNVNYTVLSGYFMPLRAFEIGISLISNKRNKFRN